MKNRLLLFLFLLFQKSISSQEIIKDEIQAIQNSDYFHELNEEKFFIHTNKTTYLSGEKIWWKAYVVSDFNEKSTTNTTNLYINIYDSNKKLVFHKLFLCNQGKAYGEISLPEKTPYGNYYIQLDTEWNKNFNKNYISQIEIIDPNNIVKEQKNINSNDSINVKFYPESNILLDNFHNTVFFEVKRGNKKLSNVSVKIIDQQNNKEIINTKTNDFGCGKFSFLCKPNHTYKAIVNEQKNSSLKPSTNSGIIIHRKETAENAQDISIKISPDLIEKLHGSHIYAVIHRNNALLYLVPFKINKANKKYLLRFSKEDLFNGVNKISLFNNKNQIIAERNFFIETKKNIDLAISKKAIKKDSLELDLKLYKQDIPLNLSISVLAENTKSNDNNKNIITSLLLDPYISNTEEYNSKTLDNHTNLDVILHKHATKTSKTKIKKNKHTFERGMYINGIINTEFKKNYKVLLSSKSNQILEVTTINEKGEFLFENLAMEDASNYKLGLLDEKGLIIKAKFYIYKKNTQYSPSPNLLDDEKNIEAFIVNNTFFNLNKEREVLDEVIVKSHTKNNIKTLYERTPRELGSGFAKKIPIKKSQEISLTLIEHLNNQSGVVAFERSTSASIVIKRASKDSFYGTTEALVIFDGVTVTANALIDIRLNEIESVTINASGGGYGLLGRNGVVKIKSKTGKNNNNNYTNKNYFKSSVEFGFTTPKNFENTPLFIDNNPSNSFYDILDWIPNYNVLPNTQNKLKINTSNYKKVKLFINGINEKGELIQKTITL